MGRAAGGIAVLMLLTACISTVPGLCPAPPGQTTETVYVVNHGWHTGLVIEKDKLPDQAKPPEAHLVDSRYLEFGWGDQAFYRAKRATAALALKAALWPTPSVLHITGLQRPPHCLFPRSGVIKVVMSGKGFRRLCAFVSASYFRDARGKMIDMGPGKLKNSRFYKAAGTYILPKTCNVWTAKALQSAGCPIPAFQAIRARDLFRQAEKFGTVIREFPDRP